MSQTNSIKKFLQFKPEVVKIFNDIDEYRDFCVTYGYQFNEADLYNERSNYGEFSRYKKGKLPKDNWTATQRQNIRRS
jgi:hypothetical protein